MCVDQQGMHCVLLADHEIFYCNWDGDRLWKISTSAKEGQGDAGPNVMPGHKPPPFRSVDISSDDACFDLLVGTQDGQIFHALVEYNEDAGQTYPLTYPPDETFASVLELPDAKAILDLKIATVRDASQLPVWTVVLAATESGLY